MRRGMLIAGVLGAIGAGQAFGIVIRHDRDDADHVAMGEGFDAVGSVGRMGVCTLVSPDWVLTAAHVAQGVGPFSNTVRIAGQERVVARVVVHSTWKGRPGPGSVDMALMQLAAPVEGVEPVGLYFGDDEVDKVATLVGNGDFGNGIDGLLGGDGRWRAAQNVVDSVNGSRLEFIFDAPGAALEMEGISGAGDSGGPALLEADGQLFIAGVSSMNYGTPKPCLYGSHEVYSRVSTERAWLREVIANPSGMGRVVGSAVDVSAGVWPAGRVSEIAQSFFARFDADEMAAFEGEFRSPEALAQRPMDERVAFWRDFKTTHGALRAIDASERDASFFTVRAEAAGSGQLIVFEFMFDEETGFLTGIGIRTRD